MNITLRLVQIRHLVRICIWGRLETTLSGFRVGCFFIVLLLKIKVFYNLLHFRHNFSLAKDIFAFFLIVFTLVRSRLDHGFAIVFFQVMSNIFFIYVDSSIIKYNGKLAGVKLHCFDLGFAIRR